MSYLKFELSGWLLFNQLKVSVVGYK